MKKYFSVLMLVLAIFVSALGTHPLHAQDDGMPTLDQLSAGWNTLFPGGDTLCAHGTEYSFHVRRAESSHLLIFFNGGGACWFGRICDEGSTTYNPAADNDSNDPNALPGGIFDFDNPENPFAYYNMVFVSYCTGDVHIGNQEETYEVPAFGDVAAHEVTIYHYGYHNAMSALNWTFENFTSPDTIFVAGSSAGSIASPFYAGLVAEHYPDARIAQLGDGSGGYRAPEAAATLNEAWGVASIWPDWEQYANATPENIVFESYYLATSSRFPNMTMATYNAANDSTQNLFLAVLGAGGTPLVERIQANNADLAAAIPSFHSYIAGGTLHTILRLPEFYAYTVEGVRIRDWVANLANGEAVEDVACTDCTKAPDAAE
ncbi:MAG: hypothetical protein HY862_11110 [Chloroflexi bacterium]|nr:hypothetical protein [Chloroflexota bacterium]